MENSGMTTKAVIVTEQCDQNAMEVISSIFNIRRIREIILSYLNPRDLCTLAAVLSSAAIPKGIQPSIDRYIMDQGLMAIDRRGDLTSISADAIASFIKKFKKHKAITYSENKSLKPDIEDRRRVVDFHITEIVVSDYDILGSRWDRFRARTHLSSFEYGAVGKSIMAVGATGGKVFFINGALNLGRGKDNYLLIVYAPSYEQILDYMLGDFYYHQEFITPLAHRVRVEHDQHKEPNFETSGGWLHFG